MKAVTSPITQKITETVRVLSYKRLGMKAVLHPGKQELAKGQEH
jgi:hypothetical protein